MGLSLKPEHLKRYAQIARLLHRYGRSDLVKQVGLDQALTTEDVEPLATSPEAEHLANDLEAMGPTYVKLGQLLSSRVDLLPPAYIEALSRLQDDIEPISYGEVERIIQEELGVRISKAFQELETEPIAAASLGQVHRARLRDGRQVAVKVQRPGVRESVQSDLIILGELAGFLDDHTEMGRRYEFEAMLLEMRRSLLAELDYTKEATHLSTLAENLAEFRSIVIPRPVADYTTTRVLTMDYVHGKKITAVSPLTRMEMDGVALADDLFRAYLKQILVDGFFHADPHPGNVFITDDHRLALLDVGMVGRLTPAMQDQLLRLLLAISEGRGEETSDLLVGLSERLSDFDEAAFEREVTNLVIRYQNASADQLQVGRVMMAVTRAAGENGLRVPPQLTVLGKTLLNLDQVGRALDPQFEPNAAIQRHSAELLRRRMLKSATPGSAFTSMLELNEFVQRLPGRLNRMLDTVSASELELRVRVVNDLTMLGGLQKIANRIAVAIVLASLIIGAAMLMRVETSFRIFGYPGLAMLFFLAAALGGFALVLDILHDARDRDGRG